jgi:hypothetical protein
VKIKLILITMIIITSLVLAVSISSGLLDEQINHYPTGTSALSNTGDFVIDSNTILDSLDRAETQVFKPAIATPEVYTSPDRDIIYSWSQSDYWKIAGALHQYVWNEPIEDWQLYRMYYYTDCADELSGFAIGDFVVFKGVVDQWKIRYAAHEIVILPLVNSASWGENSNFARPLLGWKSIDLGTLKVTADDALRIAEENGGRTARLGVGNECRIHLLLRSDVDNGWSVKYANNNELPIFEMHIDPYTGEYKIIDSNK